MIRKCDLKNTDSGDLNYLQNIDPEELEQKFNPKDIVDRAGTFKNEDITAWLWDNVLEPNDISAVTTDNGTVVPDNSLNAKRTPSGVLLMHFAFRFF